MKLYEVRLKGKHFKNHDLVLANEFYHNVLSRKIVFQNEKGESVALYDAEEVLSVKEYMKRKDK